MSDATHREPAGQVRELDLVELLTALGIDGSSATDVESLAAGVDAVRQGRKLPAGVDAGQALEVLRSRLVMERTADLNHATPPVLISVVERTLRSEKRVVPSMIVELSRRGLSLIKSTLAGLDVQPQVAVPVRAGNGPSRPHLEMHQVTGNGLTIEYQVVQESPTEMMLAISLREKPEGVYRIDLREEDRLVASQTLSRATDRATFSRISEGGYQVDIAGPASHSFGLLVTGAE